MFHWPSFFILACPRSSPGRRRVRGEFLSICTNKSYSTPEGTPFIACQPSLYAHCPAHGFLLLPLSTNTLAAPMFSTWQSNNKNTCWGNKAALHADRMDSIAIQRDFSILNSYKSASPQRALAHGAAPGSTCIAIPLLQPPRKLNPCTQPACPLLPLLFMLAGNLLPFPRREGVLWGSRQFSHIWEAPPCTT